MFEFDTHEAIVLDLVNSTKSSLYSILVADGHPRSKIPALKDALDVTSFALSQIAAILEPLKAKVQVLHDSYNQLLDRQTNAVNYISLSCVPDDILTDIMLLSMPEGGSSLHRPSPFPLNLTQVCKKWRSLVFSDSRLWSSFQIDMPNMKPYFRLAITLHEHPLYTRLSRALDLFHTKSMASPLAVGVTLTASNFEAPAKDLLRQMAAHSSGGRDFVFRLDSAALRYSTKFSLIVYRFFKPSKFAHSALAMIIFLIQHRGSLRASECSLTCPP